MSTRLGIINTNVANEAKELMGARFATMIKYFVEDTQMYLMEIEQGLKDQDAQSILLPVHTIKSSARQLGAERVENVAKEIEFLCREIIAGPATGDLRLDDMYAKLKQEVAEAVPLLIKMC